MLLESPNNIESCVKISTGTKELIPTRNMLFVHKCSLSK